MRMLAKIISDAHAWGIPVMGEMVPGGFDSPDHMRTAESISIASRIGAELGSDWVKIPYAEGFEEVTSTCYVPAVILGGAKKGSERGMLEKIRTALDVGAKGVAIGRNIFQADDPQAMTAAVAALIHENVSVDEAMKYLKWKKLSQRGEIMKRFEKQVVLITGAANGIGKACAQRFAEEGAFIACLDVTDWIKRRSRFRMPCIGCRSDACIVMSPIKKISIKWLRSVMEKWGRIDVLVGSAGIYTGTPLVDVSEKQWQRMIDINLTGVFLTNKQLLQL